MPLAPVRAGDPTDVAPPLAPAPCPPPPRPAARTRPVYSWVYIDARGLGGTRYCSYAAFMAHNRAVPAARTDYFGLINLITPLQLHAALLADYARARASFSSRLAKGGREGGRKEGRERERGD